MDKLLKQENMDYDYRNMPVAQSSQQCLRLLDKNWKSFFKSIKDWSKHKDKYTGRPKLPKYLPKNGRNILILTNMNCKLKDGIIKFPKSFNGFTLKTKCNNLQQVRILPRNKYLVVDVVYNKEYDLYKLLIIYRDDIVRLGKEVSREDSSLEDWMQEEINDIVCFGNSLTYGTGSSTGKPTTETNTDFKIKLMVTKGETVRQEE